MNKLSEEQLLSNLERFYDLIDKYLPDSERTKKLKSFYKSIETVLATAPASGKISFHNCFIGGYVDHVIRVVEASLVLDKVWDKFEQKKGYTTEELVFSAINHDLGKLGTEKEPFYIPNTNQWEIEKQGKLFGYNPKVAYIKVPDRSLMVLHQAGIEISENEYLAIKLHDGIYEEANKSYFIQYNDDFKLKNNLVYILHQADFLSATIENQKNKK
jgi:hypothetical protein